MKNSDKFKESGYCLVKSVIPNDFRDFITQYALFDELQNFTLDLGQVPGAHAKYLDPAMESLLLYLLNPMQENTGLDLYPTYSYFRVYRNGQELTPHVDRPSCEISSTVCFNFNYDSSKYKWPIFMEGNSIDLDPGDMAIYRGCDLTHWREKFTPPNSEDAWHVQGFFHYVDANGPYANWKYDKREHVGQPRHVPLILYPEKQYLRVNSDVYLKGNIR
jgi:hypothetical protein